jgi:predicted ester cyclase
VDAYVSGDTSWLPEIIDAEHQDRSYPAFGVGPAGVQRAIEQLHAGFTELKVSIEQCVSQGDWVAFRMEISGTHSGEFNGKAGTGQRVEFTAADFAKVRGGKFVELWSVQDTAALLLGIGMKLQ